MEFVKAMKIKSEICKAQDDCFKCPLKCCSDFLTHSSEEAEKVLEEWELDAEWKTLPKGSIIIVNHDYDGKEGMRVIRVFDHYDVQEKEVFYVAAGILKDVLASAPIHHCKIYEVGDYDGNPNIGDKVIFKPRNYANGKEKTNDPNWNEHGVVEKKFVNAFDEGLYWIRLDDGKLHFANQKEIEVI